MVVADFTNRLFFCQGRVISPAINRTPPKPFKMVDRPKRGMRTNVVSMVPAMLPIVDSAYKVPELVPTELTDSVDKRIEKGETIPIPILGNKKRTTEVTSGPLCSLYPTSTNHSQILYAKMEREEIHSATRMQIEFKSILDG